MSETTVDSDLDPFASLPEVDHADVGRSASTLSRGADTYRLVPRCPQRRRRGDEVGVDTFVASFRQPGVVVPPEEQFINEIHEPRHGRIRKVINATVAHHKAMRVEPFVRQLCSELLDPIVARGEGELVDELVAPIPVNVIAHLIGVPPGDWALFRRWSDEVVEGSYPTTYRNERGSGLAGAHPEFTAYVDGLIADRRRKPTATTTC